MTRAVPAVLLLLAVSAWAAAPAKKQKAPPPPVEEAIVEEPLPEEEFADPEPAPDLFAEEDPPPDARTTTTRSSRKQGDLTDEEAGLVALGTLCCCAFMLIGLVVLIVWLVKRGTAPKTTGGPVQSSYPPPGARVTNSQPPGSMQLSIFALALEPQARAIVEQQLAQLGISSVPTTPPARGQLVREAARALLTVQPSWRQFGYGEKPGIADLQSAESSYRTASEDFRGRAVSVGATATSGEGLVVVTLLICCRRPLLGVSRLDDPLQVRNVLEDRMRVTDAELLGAELLWAPAAAGGTVTEAEIGLRFPEMLPLSRAAI